MSKSPNARAIYGLLKNHKTIIENGHKHNPKIALALPLCYKYKVWGSRFAYGVGTVRLVAKVLHFSQAR